VAVEDALAESDPDELPEVLGSEGSVDVSLGEADSVASLDSDAEAAT